MMMIMKRMVLGQDLTRTRKKDARPQEIRISFYLTRSCTLIVLTTSKSEALASVRRLKNLGWRRRERERGKNGRSEKGERPSREAELRLSVKGLEVKST